MAEPRTHCRLLSRSAADAVGRNKYRQSAGAYDSTWRTPVVSSGVYVIVLVLGLSALASVSASSAVLEPQPRRQIVGAIPSAAIPTEDAPAIEWAELTWPGIYANSTADVSFRKANLTDPAVAGGLG
eukprot:scaffold31930_cov24-Prasinocladus_malaysianus.AAC.1